MQDVMVKAAVSIMLVRNVTEIWLKDEARKPSNKAK